MKGVFTGIYQNNFWRSDQSVSGEGSTIQSTEYLREQLPGIFVKYGVGSILDIPCGDFNWMSKVNLKGMTYFGADVVDEIVEINKIDFSYHSFNVMDITTSLIPPVDMIFCRDLLGHFANWDVKRALTNIKKSPAKYLMATTFPNHETNGDIKTGQWRPINLASLYGLPDPLEYVSEHCTIPGFEDKAMGIWRLR